MPLDPILDHPFLEGLNTALIDKLEEVRLELLRHRQLMEAGQLSAAGLLIQEFLNRTDLDGGKFVAGSIYGVHFAIDLEDPEIPPILPSIHSHPAWMQPASVITWAQYLALPPA